MENYIKHKLFSVPKILLVVVGGGGKGRHG